MRHMVYITVITLLLTSLGCGSKKGVGSSSNNIDNVHVDSGNPPVTEPITPPTLASGTSVPLLGVSSDTLSDYVGWPVGDDVTDIKVVVSLKRYGSFSKSGGGYDYAFGGKVSIQFKDGTANYSDEFSSLILDPYMNTVPNDLTNNRYNLLSTDYPGLNGAIGYHGFFEDTRTPRLVPPYPYNPILGGAIVLVIDQTIDNGDGAGPVTANGSVWFKNFLAQYPMGPIPNTSCWYISSGPYDCRAWKSGNGVNTKAALYPDQGYVRLGSFTGLEIRKAFNNEI